MADKKLMDDVEWPSWYDGKKIDEVAFCYSFLKLHPKGNENCCTYRTVRTAVFKSVVNTGLGKQAERQYPKSSLVKSENFYTTGSTKIILR